MSKLKCKKEAEGEKEKEMGGEGGGGEKRLGVQSCRLNVQSRAPRYGGQRSVLRIGTCVFQRLCACLCNSLRKGTLVTTSKACFRSCLPVFSKARPTNTDCILQSAANKQTSKSECATRCIEKSNAIQILPGAIIDIYSMSIDH